MAVWKRLHKADTIAKATTKEKQRQHETLSTGPNVSKQAN